MNFYPLIRPLLFSLPPEAAHAFTLVTLRWLQRSYLLPNPTIQNTSPLALMGLHFPNRVGLAAGFDKNATCIDGLGALGFGFIEVGTVTPRMQRGNAKPRLFRLIEEQALINSMGFPNDGAEPVAHRLTTRRYASICGVNIGKNAGTPLENAADDYIATLSTVYGCADYVAINISSPNTEELRRLQHRARLEPLLDKVCVSRSALERQTRRRVPLMLKLTCDLDEADLIDAAHIAQRCDIDGIIATNTTLARDGLSQSVAKLQGGLSGVPLLSRALRTVQCLRTEVGADFPIIGVGGIDSADDAVAMRVAGADLVQIYSGLVFRGPALIREIVQRFAIA